MTDNKDGKKKATRGEDRRGAIISGERRNPTKLHFDLEQSRRKGSRRSGKERRKLK